MTEAEHDEDFPRDAEEEKDPYARPSDMPPPEDDPEPADLGALAAGSRPSSPTGLKVLADDARIDLAALSRAPEASGRDETPHASSRPAPGLDAEPADAESAHVAREAPEWTPRRSALPAWTVPVAVGFAFGLVAGAVLFRSAGAPEPAASAPPSVAHPPPPAPAVSLELALPASGAPAGDSVRPTEPAAPGAAPLPVKEGAAGAADSRAGTAGVPTGAPAERGLAERGVVPAGRAALDHLPGAPFPLEDSNPPAGERSSITVTPAADEPATGVVSPARPVTASGVPAPAPAGNVDALLDEALSAPARQTELKRARETSDAESALPLTPTREDVEAAVAVLRPAIRGCAMGQSGLATADIVVRPDGTVAGVRVSGAPFAGAASGRCMEGVVRRAHFPRFRKPSFQIRYPFAIQ